MQVMMTDAEIEILKEYVTSARDGGILEYGSGGSTSFIAGLLRPQQHLVSIENNVEWYELVTESLLNVSPQQKLTRVLSPSPEITLNRDGEIMPMPIHYSTPYEEIPVGIEQYLRPIPSEYFQQISLALVDGIARGSCLAILRTLLQPGTPVLLHDYMGRELWYDWAANLYTRIRQCDSMLVLQVP